jgi:hypothetical protein
LRRTEVHEILVVGKNNDGVGVSQEKMAPGFKGMHYGEELTIVNLVVSFCRGK